MNEHRFLQKYMVKTMETITNDGMSTFCPAFLGLSYDIVLIDAIIFPPANLVMLEIRHG